MSVIKINKGGEKIIRRKNERMKEKQAQAEVGTFIFLFLIFFYTNCCKKRKEIQTLQQ